MEPENVAQQNVEITDNQANITQSPKNVSKLKNEEINITRNDSYSKFGDMETINLQQETNPPLSNVPKNDNTKSKQEKLPDKENKQESTTPLSHYFGDSNVQKNTDSSAQFFDVISSAASTENVQQQTKNPTATPKIKKELEENRPHLLKFFAEDKSGKDKSGKEFFDKISTTPSLGIQVLPVGTAGILDNISESLINDEMNDAWIPSDNTRRILVSLVTSPPGSFVPDKRHLTSPNLVIEEEMDDPIKLLLQEINSPMAQQRKVLMADDVPQNEDGLKKLINSNCYHAAINLTGRLLNQLKKTQKDSRIKHTSYSLKLWFIRIALFVKLRKFSYAEVESEAFGDFDRPDLYYEYYPDMYKGRKGSMVPFSFRLLLTELPQYQGNHQTSLNNMYSILQVVKKIIQNLENGFAEDGTMVELPETRKQASLNLWYDRERSVLYSILNCFFSQKDYIMSVSVVQILLEKDKLQSPLLYSALGRIYLQLGDLSQANKCFNQADIEAEKLQDKNHEIEKLVNKALLSISNNENEEAYNTYEQALKLAPNNAMLVNNMAVCSLYMGKLKESLTLLEKTIQKNTIPCLHDGILFNICTLYELESSHCTTKKHAILNLVSRYAGDSFMVSSLKIPPNTKA